MNLNGTQGSPYQGLTQTRPYDFGTDAIERQRVSLGQSLIDADFEYGLQATKWQTYQELRRFPSFFEVPGSDYVVSNVQSDGTTTSNVVVYFSNTSQSYLAFPPPVGSVISVQGLSNAEKNADRAEGFFLVASNVGSVAGQYANTCNYVAKGAVTNTSNLQSSATVLRRGGIFNNGSLKIPVSNIGVNGSNIFVNTLAAHGLMPGTPITANSAGFTFNGNFFVSNVTSINTFNIVTTSTLTVATAANSNLYMNPYSYAIHRPYDGGVLMTPAQPSFGAAITRQSKKVFRYQSGKGLLWSSGTLFCPNNDVTSVNVYGITTTLTSNSNGATGVTLTVSTPSLLGLNQNVTFTPSQTTFGNSNILSVSGNAVTFQYTGTFPTSLPTAVTQNVVATGGSLYLFNNVAVPVVSILGFGPSNLFSISGVSNFTGNVADASGTTLTSNYIGTFPQSTGLALGSNVTLTTPIATSAFAATAVINLAASGSQTNFPALANVSIGGSYQSNVVASGVGAYIRLRSNTGSAPTYPSFAPQTLIAKNSVNCLGSAANVIVTLASPVTIFNSNSAVNGITGFVGNVISAYTSQSTINLSPVTWTTIPDGTGPLTFGNQATVTSQSNLITFSSQATNTNQPFSFASGGTSNGFIITGKAAGTPSPVAITSWPATGLPSTGSVYFVQTANPGNFSLSNTLTLSSAQPAGIQVTGNTATTGTFNAFSLSSTSGVTFGANVITWSQAPLNGTACNVVVAGSNYGGNTISSFFSNIVLANPSSYFQVNSNTQILVGGTLYANVQSSDATGTTNPNIFYSNLTASFPTTGFPLTSSITFNNVATISASTSNLIFSAHFNTQTLPALNTQLSYAGQIYGNAIKIDGTSVTSPNVTYLQNTTSLPTTGIPFGSLVTFGPSATISTGNSLVTYTNVNAPNQVFVEAEPVTVFSYPTTVTSVDGSNISFVAPPPVGLVSKTFTINPTSTLSLGTSYQTPVSLASYTNFPTAGANVQVNNSLLAQTSTVPETTSLTLTSATALPVVSCVSPFTTISSAYSLVPGINVASTNGFVVGETLTFSANSSLNSNLGLTTISSITPQTATSNGILKLAITKFSNADAITIGETIAGQPVSITTAGPHTVNVASITGLSAGQTIANYMGPNLGQLVINGTATVASNTQVTFKNTGSFPPAGLSIVTKITVFPAGSNIQLVTTVVHGAPQSGATIIVKGISTANVNGTYNVSSVVDSKTLNVVSTSQITSFPIVPADQPRFIMSNWHGASVRAGCFDDQNGVFWEYDGQTLFVVRRSSTFQITGTSNTNVNAQVLYGSLVPGVTGALTGPTAISINAGDVTATITVTSHTVQNAMYTTNLGGALGALGVCWVLSTTPTLVVVGFSPAVAAIASTAPTTTAGAFVLANTRFQDQLRVNDKFTLKGMTHQVTSIQGQGVLTFNPPFRGAANIPTNAPATVCRIKETRVPQSQFNRDTIDGSGPSGFKIDLTKMQMTGIQYTWYGAGFIDFMMRGSDGNWVYAHRIKNNNVNDESYMRTGNMPVRYELVNECQSAIATLSSAITPGQTTIPINETTTYFPSSGTLMIDSEFISYTGKTANTFTGCVRPATLNYNVSDIARVFTGQAASNHLANTTTSLVSTTCTPSLTHWGSAFLMDGNFDQDRGYFFNYANTSVNVAANSTLPAFAIRLAPSVSGGIIGDIGSRELLNRAQMLLQKLEVTSANTVTTLGYLNASNVVFSTGNWLSVNSQGGQPSFGQIYPGNSILTLPQPGERIFQTIVQGNNQNNLDLTALKEMTNAVIGGNQPFPDGPDVLTILVQNGTAGPSGPVSVNLFWSEAQA